MRAGELDRRIELRRRVLARDPDSQQEVESWPIAYARPWAKKIDAGGSESVVAQQLGAEIRTEFHIRYRDDVLATDRIILGELAYNIQSVDEIGRREGLKISATAVRP